MIKKYLCPYVSKSKIKLKLNKVNFKLNLANFEFEISTLEPQIAINEKKIRSSYRLNEGDIIKTSVFINNFLSMIILQ